MSDKNDKKDNDTVDVSAQLKMIETSFSKSLASVAEMLDERLSKLAETKNNVSISAQNDQKSQQFNKNEAPKKGNELARCVRYMVAANGDPSKAIDMALEREKEFGDRWAKSYEFQKIREKAMGQDDLTAGGALVPPTYSDSIIEELNAKAAVRSLGASTLPIVGTYSQPFIDTGATSYYVGESQNGTPSALTTGSLNLSEKTLVTLVPLSNQLLRNGGARAESAITQNIVTKMALKEDVTFIRSVGSQAEPMGMLYWANASNKFNSVGATVANITTDLGNCINKLMEFNVNFVNPGWIFAPRTYKALTTARDGNNNLVWAEEMTKLKTLMGYPYRVTTQVPKNLGSGDKSEVYFANFSDLLIGEGQSMMVSVHPDAAYYDGSAVVSGLSRNETTIRVISSHDFGATQRGKEIAVCEAVAWGA